MFLNHTIKGFIDVQSSLSKIDVFSANTFINIIKTAALLNGGHPLCDRVILVAL